MTLSHNTSMSPKVVYEKFAENRRIAFPVWTQHGFGVVSDYLMMRNSVIWLNY